MKIWKKFLPLMLALLCVVSAASAENDVLELPDSLVNIEQEAFYQNAAIRQVILPDGVKRIETRAFAQSGLTEITIPASVEFIAADAFSGCGSMVAWVDVYSYAHEWCENNGVAFEFDTDATAAESAAQEEVIRMVNEFRAENGLHPLEYSKTLTWGAGIRANEISELFSHTRPDGSLCFTVVYGAMGENIAAGYRTPQAVMEGWKNSPGHRANMLQQRFGSIGVGARKIDGRWYWVQLFG